jgi:SAM-dependent methyltransferase
MSASYRLAPGNVLQLMYVKERLGSLAGKRFFDVGAGNGQLSSCLLELGLCGVGFDLNPAACENNAALNKDAIAAGRYRVENADFLRTLLTERADVIISSMVLEHLLPTEVDAYFERCQRAQAPGGMIVTLVPGSPGHWGIEDEIAGHRKRYSFSCFDEIASAHGLSVAHLAGLTYPLSNWLLPLSNFLTRRRERHKLGLTMQERTVLSGNRDVRWKTVFPRFVAYLVNEITLYPFYLLQRAFRHHPGSMVIYCELTQASNQETGS